jgi:hypothetical protein
MTQSKPRVRSRADTYGCAPADHERAAPEAPADVLALGWIAALRRLDPETRDLMGALHVVEDWTVETLLKLGFAAPDRAYEVGVRIVELSDDPWILDTVGVSVFEHLLRRNEPHFIARLSADARRSPRLLRTLARIEPRLAQD